ncbi:putative DNA endonuclease SmrA [Vibrio stylophorae]|uniref:DNA endonuclease SmrA n=1 Tax=Vibrio stylophorae TaxID=659351 RepID=A0ABM8ZV09_9VIBR|nr:DNA endonuclease SmrA [Vibrio stylophorae]CAH0534151.1 putative DNA endonuclease SmrA [Vibrio stylophorae]
MNESDFSDDFASLMGDVKPIAQDKASHAQQHQVSAAQLARQQSAQQFTSQSKDGLSLTNAPMVKPDQPLGFKRDGIQDGVYKKLRLGKYPIGARLDLHRKSLQQARDEVVQFLNRCQRLDIRSLIIVHGKGEKSNPPALMKSYVAYWLTQLEMVVCYHSALAQHGGQGALYVMIKKSAESKLENREQHRRRG